MTRPRKALAYFAAAVTVAGGGVAIQLATQTTPATLTVSATGTDASCSRSGSACGTFQRAYNLAQAGDTITVNSGVYRSDFPAEGAVKLRPGGPAGVTFVCGDSSPVTFAAPADQFVITAHDVAFRGGCFHFNRVWIGDPANGISTANVTVDGASMMMFQVSGSSNVTISNSTVGPDVACAAPGSGTSCQNLTGTNEAYFALAGEPNTQYTSPKVNTGGVDGTVPSLNVSLPGDTFINHQTRDSGAWHGECLFIDDPGGSGHVDGGSFSGCFYADVFFNSPDSGWAFTGVTFGPSKEPINAGSSLAAVKDTPAVFVDLAVKCRNGQVMAGWALTGNTFAHGWDLNSGGCSGATFPGLVIGGNTGGGTQSPPQTGPQPTTVPVTTTAAGLGLAVSLITVKWAPVLGATGYTLSRDGVKVATAGVNARSAVFAVTAGAHTLTVAAAGRANTQTVVVTSGATT